MRKVSCFECSSSPNVSFAFSCDISTRTSETGKLGFVRNTGAYVQQIPSKETKKLSSAFHSLQFLNSRIYRGHTSCRREQRSVLIFVDGEKHKNIRVTLDCSRKTVGVSGFVTSIANVFLILKRLLLQRLIKQI